MNVLEFIDTYIAGGIATDNWTRRLLVQHVGTGVKLEHNVVVDDDDGSMYRQGISIAKRNGKIILNVRAVDDRDLREKSIGTANFKAEDGTFIAGRHFYCENQKWYDQSDDSFFTKFLAFAHEKFNIKEWDALE